MRVGIVGCGPIANSYVLAAPRFPGLRFVACAGRTADSESARALAERHGLQAMRYEDMLAGGMVDIVLVLTPADDHVAAALAAIAAGKHVYCEKPLAPRLADARTMVEAAASAGVQLACAPDTVLGANVQCAAQILDSGRIGPVVSGVAALCSGGMEHWHPDPAHLYARGGGPVMDKGPYYVAALVTLLGPVASVRADGRRGVDQRTVTAPASPRRGETISVAVPTTVHATLNFTSGALITLIVSWDVNGHALPDIELYGVTGSLRLADPNWFGDSIHVHGADGWESMDTSGHPLGGVTMTDVAGVPRADHRGVGLAEMADAITQGGQPLCSGALALHVLEVLAAIVAATETGGGIVIDPPGHSLVRPRLDAARADALSTAV